MMEINKRYHNQIVKVISYFAESNSNSVIGRGMYLNCEIPNGEKITLKLHYDTYLPTKWYSSYQENPSRFCFDNIFLMLCHMSNLPPYDSVFRGKESPYYGQKRYNPIYLMVDFTLQQNPSFGGNRTTLGYYREGIRVKIPKYFAKILYEQVFEFYTNDYFEPKSPELYTVWLNIQNVLESLYSKNTLSPTELTNYIKLVT